MSLEKDNDWKIDCSDDELYDVTNNLVVPFSVPGGKKVWEPCGSKIASLYNQLEKSDYIELKWVCPGKRSPSDHSRDIIDNSINESNDNKQNSMEPTQFDFDEEQPMEKCNSFPKSAPKRRTTQGQRKITKLDKVMNDMKKYQAIDSQNPS